ncbi:MAG: hypothetical protein D3904_10935 [Candidatus Electrothrix sp. EH2]|nr:hypothetical protein [Candidatus Electrothrix sp. EH2]
MSGPDKLCIGLLKEVGMIFSDFFSTSVEIAYPIFLRNRENTLGKVRLLKSSERDGIKESGSHRKSFEVEKRCVRGAYSGFRDLHF